MSPQHGGCYLLFIYGCGCRVAVASYRPAVTDVASCRRPAVFVSPLRVAAATTADVSVVAGAIDVAAVSAVGSQVLLLLLWLLWLLFLIIIGLHTAFAPPLEAFALFRSTG